MLAYWRKFDRSERDRAKREQKAEMERMKLEEEVREAKRQQKKLNFLLTQTELFAHFIGKKVGGMASLARLWLATSSTVLTECQWTYQR